MHANKRGKEALSAVPANSRQRPLREGVTGAGRDSVGARNQIQIGVG